MSSFSQRLLKIQEKIEEATLKSGRKKDSVKLLAVSKFHTVQEIEEAINSGLFLFGENRVQEAEEKFLPILKNNKNVSLNIIGNLQKNKIKKAVSICSCIESVSSTSLFMEIEKQCEKIQKKITVLLEYKIGEDSKHGFTSFEDLCEALNLFIEKKFKYAIPVGFMTMAPFTNSEKILRSAFINMRTISEKVKSQFPNLNLNELSMGMSGDFQIAIEEGSTEVRIGTALFGERISQG